MHFPIILLLCLKGMFMPLHVELTIKEKELLYQQDTVVLIKLKNTGSHSVSVQTSSMNPSVPVVHVVDHETGLARDCQRRAAKLELGMSQSLEPGQTLTDSFNLLDVVDDLGPGEYDISVIWEYGTLEKATSSPVSLKVLPGTPKSLYMVDAMSGSSDMKVGVWVNIAQEPYSLVRSTFLLKPGRLIASKNLETKCPVDCEPVISAPACQEVMTTQWIAWIDGTDLAFIHVSSELGVTKEQRLKLSAPGVRLVRPLYGASSEDERIRPDGAALVCYPQAASFILQTIELNAKKAQAGPTVSMPGPAPDWMFSHVRSTGERLVTCAQSDGKKVSLFTRAWPGAVTQKAVPNTWAEWPGQLIHASASMDLEDGLNGAALILEESPGSTRKIMLISWCISSDNEFTLQESKEINWPASTPIQNSVIGISDNGFATALLRNPLGTWQFYDGLGNLKPLPFAYSRTILPIELGYYMGGGEPLLICGNLRSGFKIINLEGEPLSRYSREQD